MKLIFNGEYVKNENNEAYEFDKVIKNNYKREIKLIGGNSNGIVFTSSNIDRFEVEDGEFTIDSDNVEDLKAEINNLKNLLYVSMFDNRIEDTENNNSLDGEEAFTEEIEEFENFNGELYDDNLSIDSLNELEE